MSKVRPRPLLPLAAFKFNTVNSDRVDCGSGASLDDLAANPFSALALVFPTTLTNNRAFLAKSGTSLGWSTGFSGTTGNFSVVLGHATTSLTYVTSDTPLAKLSRWYWIALTVDLTLGAGLRAKIYSGPLGGALKLSTLTLTEPAGARGSDATVNFIIGNLNTPTLAFPGSIALTALWNRGLSFKEFSQLTKSGGSGFRESNPVGLWRPGWQGRSVDESGNANHGTITGAVISGAPKAIL